MAAEFFGPLGLALGLLTRVAVLGIACVMLVALGVHKEHGFFMNWFGNQKGEGIEYGYRDRLGLLRGWPLVDRRASGALRPT